MNPAKASRRKPARPTRRYSSLPVPKTRSEYAPRARRTSGQAGTSPTAAQNKEPESSRPPARERTTLPPDDASPSGRGGEHLEDDEAGGVAAHPAGRAGNCPGSPP